MKLSGRVALITGGGGGLGRAMALRLAREGAAVVLSDVDAEACQRVADEVAQAEQARTLALAGDVGKLEDAQACVARALEEFGRLDILVNNAGITRDSLLVRMSPEDWDAVLRVNLTGAYNCICAAEKPLRESPAGRIINIASVAGIMGNVGQSNYSASKAGLIALTKAAARDFAPSGTTVNAIAPGFIKTRMTETLLEATVRELLENIPLGRMGVPEDVAGVVAFLASDEAAYITGQVLTVDGGLVMA